MGHRRGLLLCSGVLVLAAGCGEDPASASQHAGDGSADGVGTSEASCVAPYLDDQPPNGRFGGPMPTVAPGGTVTVHGRWYTATCNDTGGDDPVVPLPPVTLTLALPGGTTASLGRVEAHGPDLGFAVDVTVPPGTTAGTATVRDDRYPGATFTFHVGR